jgi:hypothetical protein
MRRIHHRVMPRAIVLAASFATLPALSIAKPSDAALNGCAQQVVSEFAARQGLTPKYSVNLDQRRSFSDFGAAEPEIYRFTLEARDPKTGLLVARAECDAQYTGKVVAFRTLPLAGQSMTLAKGE